MGSMNEEMGKTELLCSLSPSKSVILPLTSQGQGMTHWSNENLITDDTVFALYHNKAHKLSIAGACMIYAKGFIVSHQSHLSRTKTFASGKGVRFRKGTSSSQESSRLQGSQDWA